MRDLTLQSKRNILMQGFHKRLEADEVTLQTSISVEEKEERILPVGKMSREAMRSRKSQGVYGQGYIASILVPLAYSKALTEDGYQR
jgi:hypothetical protein